MRLCPRSAGGCCAINSGAVQNRSPQRRKPLMAHGTFPKCARPASRARSIAAFSSSRFASNSSGGKSAGTLCPLRPAHTDARERLGHQKAIPRIASSRRAPAPDGMRRSARPSICASLIGPILVSIDRPARPVRGEDRRAAGLDHVVSDPAVPRARRANSIRAPHRSQTSSECA